MSHLPPVSEAQMRCFGALFPISRRLHQVDDRRVISALVAQAGVPERPRLDSTHLKAHRTAASLAKKGLLHAASDAHAAARTPILTQCATECRPVCRLLIAGQTNDHKGAAMLLPVLPQARELLDDRGCDSARLRADLLERGIEPCIPFARSRKFAIPHDKTFYRQRHRIENAFGRLKHRRRIATR